MANRRGGRDPAHAIWRQVCDGFARLHGQRAAELWLSNARPRSFHRGLFTVELPNEVAKTAIDATYAADLERLFHEITGSTVRVRTRVAGYEAASREAVDTGERSASGPEVGVCVPFVEHESNRLAARAVARFVASADDGFNPLFVHGPPGSGKTALGRHALQLLRQSGQLGRMLVLSGEALTQDVSRAAREGTLDALRSAWTGHDLILLDEAHRLRGRRRSQLEAVTFISGALERGGRVLVLSRHPAQEIHVLDRRLASHFRGGMEVAMGTPQSQDRLAVVDAVAGALASEVGPGVVEAVATRCGGTLMDAVDALQRATRRAVEEGAPLNLAHVEPLLARSGRGAASMNSLLEEVSQRCGVPIDRIRSPEKSRPVVAARHITIYLATRSLGMSAREVCRYLRLQSPSVVAYARRRVEDRRAADPTFERLVLELQAGLDGAQRDIAW